MKKTLLLVDIQNDFCAGGSLAVSRGDEVVPIANQLQSKFDLIVATQDWHPANHTSFARSHPGAKVGDVIDLNGIEQISWPVHCVQGSPGADFHPGLASHRINKIFHKGVDSKIDSYSAFYDNAHLRTTGLDDYLRQEGVNEVYILGLATDYCVKYSVLDAIKEGFTVYVVKDACRGVELKAGDVEKAFQTMQEAGAHLLMAEEIG